MAAWYVLSSLGLYELSHGGTDFAFGSPLFERVVVSLDNDGTGSHLPLTIIAQDNSKDNVYVQSVSWNGELLTNVNSISFDLLRQGGELLFVMGPSPASSMRKNQKKFLRSAK
jgi:putative alpha-1,2-mannosidase